jgi:hypothetical protein
MYFDPMTFTHSLIISHSVAVLLQEQLNPSSFRYLLDSFLFAGVIDIGAIIGVRVFTQVPSSSIRVYYFPTLDFVPNK